ncbi:MAG: polymer-forming cytoskeletal protein [Gemmatimonadales bacterium]|nr:MAG: polymer-forming cytoskeletal protein [Gemmatimonadales bacterium]
MNTIRIPIRWMAALLVAAFFVGPASSKAQDAGVAGSTVLLAGDVARLELELSSGQTTTLELNTGHVVIDGADVGSYELGGVFEQAWRDLLRSPAIADISDLSDLLSSWEPAAGGSDGTARTAILRVFDRFDSQMLADAVDGAGTLDSQERVTIVPRGGSIGQIAAHLEHLSETMDRIAGEQLELDRDFALVVYDNYRIAKGTVVDGNVALLDGDLVVDGTIEGDVLVLGGHLDLEPGSMISGNVRSVGGNVETTGAVVMGEILSLSNVAESVDAAMPDMRISVSAGDAPTHWNRRNDRNRGFIGSITHNLGHAIGGVFRTAMWILGLMLIGMLLVYFTPNRLEVVSATARADVLRSFGVGLAGEFLFAPVLALLAVLIVTWLVIPFYVLAAGIAVPLGYLAVARATGEALVDRQYPLFERFNLNRANTYYYVFNGLLLFMAPFAIASVLHLLGGWAGFIRGLIVFVGVVLSWAAATTGLGAVILTRGGRSGDFGGFRRSPKDFFEDMHLDTPAAPGSGEAGEVVGNDA